MSPLEVIVGLILCFGVFLWWWQRSARLFWEKHGVSYVSGPPFIGALKDIVTFKKGFPDFFMDIYNHEKFKDDPVTGVYFFHKPILIIRHPELIKNVFIKDFSDFADRNLSSDPHDDVIGSNNILALKGQAWKNMRKKLSQVFTVGKLKNFFKLLLEVSDVLEQKLTSEITSQSREYEMKELASYFSTDTIAITAFGVKANSLLNPNAEFYKNAMRALNFDWKRGFEFAICIILPEVGKRLGFTFFSKETNKFLRSYMNYVIEERKKSGIKRNDLIDILNDLKEEDPDFFTRDVIVAQAALFLIAGAETSSSAISFALYELSRHLEIQEKLRKEIKTYLEKHDEKVEYETINEMEYLTCVIQETLRLYPTAPFLDRTCLPVGKDSYSLEPYHSFSIPRGMPVAVPAIAVQRDPKFFPNPLEFIPERFSHENRDSINPVAFLPFGIGPRSCVGLRFGYLQVKLALVTILRNYRVEATERTPKSIKFDKRSAILVSEEPLYMSLTRI